MPATLQQRYTLVATGGRYYTFTPLGNGGAEVLVAFTGLRYSTEATMPADEARQLWRRLLQRGYERW